MGKHNLPQFLKLFYFLLFWINLNCSKNDEPYSYLKITPSDLILSANTQDWITFNLNGFANEGFTNLKIKQKKNNTPTIIWFIGIIFQIRTFYIIKCEICLVIYSIYLIVDTIMICNSKKSLGGYGIDREDYIVAALMLYLDIIMMFLYILKILGKSRD